MKRISLLLLSMLLLISACSRSDSGAVIKSVDGVTVVKNPYEGKFQDRDKPALSFELIQAIGREEGSDEAVLDRPGAVTTDDSGNIYFYDSGDSRLHKWSPEGELIWRIGQQGQGPGDFEWVNGLLCDGHSTLYVSNQDGRRIDRYTLAGAFVDACNVDQLDLKSLKMAGLAQGRYLVCSQTERAREGADTLKTHVYWLDTENGFARHHEIEVIEKLDYQLTPMVGASHRVALWEDGVVVASQNDYSHHYYNSQGRLVKKVCRDFPHILHACWYKQGDRLTAYSIGVLSPPFNLADGSRLVHVVWADNLGNVNAYMKDDMNGKSRELNYIQAWDLYDSEGVLQEMLPDGKRGSGMGFPQHVDADGCLYTTRRAPFPQVLKYRVHVNL